MHVYYIPPHEGRPGVMPPLEALPDAARADALEIARDGGVLTIVANHGGVALARALHHASGVLPHAERDAVEAIYADARLAAPADRGVPVGERPRPFRAPHHTASYDALRGTAGRPERRARLGEMSLAAHGTLLLDQAHDFGVATLDLVRVALRDGALTLPHPYETVQRPARPHLTVVVTWTCFGRCKGGACRCDQRSRDLYERRLSELPVADLTLKVQP